MSHNIFGWDLPPGCSVSYIPGNRPEDEKWEAVINGFWDKKYTEAKDKILADADTDLTELIDEAIEYGMDIGAKENQAIVEESKYYETRFIQEALENSKPPNEALTKIKSILGIKED